MPWAKVYGERVKAYWLIRLFSNLVWGVLIFPVLSMKARGVYSHCVAREIIQMCGMEFVVCGHFP